MNEDHIIAAILTAGMISGSKDQDIQPKDTVSLYWMTLAELIASNRPPREVEA
jgi:hypothetical protein